MRFVDTLATRGRVAVKVHAFAQRINVGVLKVYVVEGCSELVATACTSLGPICCHDVARAGLMTSAGSWRAFVGTLKCKRNTGRFAASVEGNVAETRVIVAPDALSEGTRVEPKSTTVRVLASLRCRITPPGYREHPAGSLTIALRKG